MESFLNAEGHKNSMSGLKFTIILLKGLILPIGGVTLACLYNKTVCFKTYLSQLGRVCLARLVLGMELLILIATLTLGVNSKIVWETSLNIYGCVKSAPHLGSCKHD